MGFIANAAPGIISSGLQMANTAIAGRQARRNMKKQYGYDTKMAEQQYGYDSQKMASQYKYDQQAWEMQNKYNSPMEVMRRYKDAGLNPNLIYGGGMGNTAGSAPAQEAPTRRAVAPDIRNLPPTVLLPEGIISQYQDFRLKQVTTDNAKKQGEILDSQKAKIDLENTWLSRSMDPRLNNITQDYLNKSWNQFEKQETWPYRYTTASKMPAVQQLQIDKIIQGMDIEKGLYGQKQQMFPYQLEYAGLMNEKAKRGLNLMQLQKLKEQAMIDHQRMVNDMFMEAFYFKMGGQLTQGLKGLVDIMGGIGKAKFGGKKAGIPKRYNSTSSWDAGAPSGGFGSGW